MLGMWIGAMLLGFFVVLLAMTLVYGMESIPPEPGRDKLTIIRVMPQKMVLLYFYDTDDNGEVDYITQRRILPNFTVELKPLFYIIDANRDGNIDTETEVWINTKSDGIILYNKWLELQNKEV